MTLVSSDVSLRWRLTPKAQIYRRILSRRRMDSTSFAAKCFYWERRLGDTNPQRLVFVDSRALSAILSTGHYRHRRLSSPKQNKVYHSHLKWESYDLDKFTRSSRFQTYLIFHDLLWLTPLIPPDSYGGLEAFRTNSFQHAEAFHQHIGRPRSLHHERMFAPA